MSKVFAILKHRMISASLVAAVAALTLGAWALFWDPAASNAEPSVSVSVDPSTVASNLEALHQRAMARSNDDDDVKPAANGGHAIKPEQAAMLAQQFTRAHGDATSKQTYIEIQTRNGRPVYALRIGTAFVYVDADTGAVVP
jgi:uncharacterized membrane protein YkoI